MNRVYSNPVVGVTLCGRPGRVQDPPVPTHFERTQVNRERRVPLTTKALVVDGEPYIMRLVSYKKKAGASSPQELLLVSVQQLLPA